MFGPSLALYPPLSPFHALGLANNTIEPSALFFILPGLEVNVELRQDRFLLFSSRVSCISASITVWSEESPP